MSFCSLGAARCFAKHCTQGLTQQLKAHTAA